MRKKEPGEEVLGKSIGISQIGQLLTSVRKVQGAADRAEQSHRNLQVAFALAAYRKDAGRYPAKLDDLSPKYLASVSDDLFTGKALVYRPAGATYTFFSLGVSGKAEDIIGVQMPLPPLKLAKKE